MLVRLNKFLAAAGIASRRKCDDLIMAGKVKVNNEIISTVGVRIDDEKDVVEYDGSPVYKQMNYVYILMNKPKEVLTTAEDQFSRRTVLDLVPVEERIWPVGRLDYMSTGLLILTNDGILSNRLIHPKYKVEKKYQVLLDKKIRPVDLYHFEHGLELDGKITLPCKAVEIRIIDNNSFLEVTLREGRNRQIRRMFEILNYEVQELNRIGFGSLTLTGVQPGAWRHLSEKEIALLKQQVDIQE
jgi:23S rRNA pseudouridine2605 synthase